MDSDDEYSDGAFAGVLIATVVVLPVACVVLLLRGQCVAWWRRRRQGGADGPEEAGEEGSGMELVLTGSPLSTDIDSDLTSVGLGGGDLSATSADEVDGNPFRCRKAAPAAAMLRGGLRVPSGFPAGTGVKGATALPPLLEAPPGGGDWRPGTTGPSLLSRKSRPASGPSS